MSSQVCSILHFNSLESHFIDLLSNKSFSSRFSKSRVIPDNNVISFARDIMDNLKELNILSVATKYRSNFISLDSAITNFKHEPGEIANECDFITLSDIQFFNALICLNYQIEEDYIKELDKKLLEYYDILQDIINATAYMLASRITSNMWFIE